MEKNKQSNGSKSKKRKTNDARKKKDKSKDEGTCSTGKQSKVLFTECETYELDDGDRVWIECQNWYHADCVGILNDDISDLHFICDSCI